MAALALQSTFRACGPSTCMFSLATDTVIKSFDHGNLKGMEKTLGAIKLQEYALRITILMFVIMAEASVPAHRGGGMMQNAS